MTLQPPANYTPTAYTGSGNPYVPRIWDPKNATQYGQAEQRWGPFGYTRDFAFTNERPSGRYATGGVGDTPEFIAATNRVMARQADRDAPRQNYLAGQGISGLYNQMLQGNQGQFRALEANNALLRHQRDAILPERYDIKELGLRNEIDSALKMLGVDEKDIANRRAALEQDKSFVHREYGLDMRGHENEQGRLGDQWNTGMRLLYEDASARGAVSTQGTRDTKGDLGKQLYRGIEDVNIGRERSGLKRDRSLADIQRGNQALDLQAQRIGISREDLNNQLSIGLRSLGLDRHVDALDLAERMNSNDAAIAGAAGQLWQAAVQAYQMNPQAAAQFRPSSNPSLRPHNAGGVRRI